MSSFQNLIMSDDIGFTNYYSEASCTAAGPTVRA
jgi:hypothetical protein